LNPNDYADRGSQRAIRAFVRLAHEGGYVCAQYAGREQVIVGRIKPSSKIELIEGKWGDTWGNGGRTAVLKTLRISGAKLVDPASYAVILIGRPRQGTLMRWPSAGSTIENLVKGKKAAAIPSSLSASQQEILCSEFLRSPQASKLGLPRMSHLLMPTGRTMKDLDVIGITERGKRLFVQVTYADVESATGKWKLARLQHYADESTECVLFCNCEGPYQTDGIHVFPLKAAFEEFTKTDSGKTWLEHSL
jgi:hypothetical protein